MFLLIGSKSRGQHRGKFRGLLKFSLSDEAAIYCYSTEKTKSETGAAFTGVRYPDRIPSADACMVDTME